MCYISLAVQIFFDSLLINKLFPTFLVLLLFTICTSSANLIFRQYNALGEVNYFNRLLLAI